MMPEVEPRKLEVIGPFKGSSGYDRHTREFVREFVRQGAQVHLRNLEGWSVDLPPHMRETWFDQLNRPVASRTLLHFAMPHQAQPEPGRHNVNYTMFEADRIPPAWVHLAQRHELIVLPTAAALDAWAASGVPHDRLRLCPLGVNAEHFAQPIEPLPLTTPEGRPLSSFRTRFLHVAELRPRKNHLGLLRAWIAATRRYDDAVLILKGSVFQERVLPQFRADVAELQQQLGKSLADAAPTLFLPAALTNDMVRALYAAATHYISMSHGEGWDQPMMEAAVSGLQLIAPRHTSYLTYLTDEEAWLIPSAVGPAVFEGRLGVEDKMFFDGLRWWYPDEEAAADTIRAIVQGSAGEKRSPKARITAEYTWAKAAAKLLDLTC